MSGDLCAICVRECDVLVWHEFYGDVCQECYDLLIEDTPYRS